MPPTTFDLSASEARGKFHANQKPKEVLPDAELKELGELAGIGPKCAGKVLSSLQSEIKPSRPGI